ncbi:MAG: addiction module protein [Candidatus Brocadiae bacterium]|nr:addiction module protein [Candidatus Brocadiia bacterium]
MTRPSRIHRRKLSTFDKILEAALRLRPGQREVLADLLEGSLPGPWFLSPEQEAEIKRRAEEVRSGKVKTIPLDEMLEGAFRKTLMRRRNAMRSGEVRGMTVKQCMRALERQEAKRRSR